MGYLFDRHHVPHIEFMRHVDMFLVVSHNINVHTLALHFSTSRNKLKEYPNMNYCIWPNVAIVFDFVELRH